MPFDYGFTQPGEFGIPPGSRLTNHSKFLYAVDNINLIRLS